MKKVFLTIALTMLFSSFVAAQGNAFSFQGRMNDGTNPANGQYDMQFSLFNGVTGGTQIGATVARPATTLINGVFSTTLDFGATAFNNPNAVFIEIAVKPAGSPNNYTILGPRQQLTVVPFSVRATNATNADFATNATNAQNAVNATNATNATNANTAANALSLGGVSASGFAQLNVVNTGDIRTNGALAITGNAFQPIGAKGFAKAMIVYSGFNDSTTRCYNLITNSSTGNCGFVITSPLSGVYRINFGFPVSDSYVAVTSQYLNSGGGNNNSGVNYRFFDSTSIEFFTFNPDSVNTSNLVNFTVILF